MYFKKEIIISFSIITISASNLYMPMIRLYLFLLDFLIPFLCDPDLQCTRDFYPALAALVGPVQNIFSPPDTTHFTSFVPIAQQAGQAVVPHRLSLNMCL
jgi:hypothetical protein